MKVSPGTQSVAFICLTSNVFTFRWAFNEHLPWPAVATTWRQICKNANWFSCRGAKDLSALIGPTFFKLGPPPCPSNTQTKILWTVHSLNGNRRHGTALEAQILFTAQNHDLVMGLVQRYKAKTSEYTISSYTLNSSYVGLWLSR